MVKARGVFGYCNPKYFQEDILNILWLVQFSADKSLSINLLTDLSEEWLSQV